MNIISIIHDIDIIKDAIRLGDVDDAIQMLDEVAIELKIIASIS